MSTVGGVTTLTEFLLQRIAEDEAAADRVEFVPYVGDGVSSSLQARVLAECEAKRRIVELLAERDEQDHPAVAAHATGLRLAVKELAAVYADHPDYREEWKP